MTQPSIESLDDLPLGDLRRVVAVLIEEVGRLKASLAERDEVIAAQGAEIAALKAENQALKDEIARLKGLPPRPKFKGKPSGMEKRTSKPSPGGGKKRGRGKTHDKLEVTAEAVLKAPAPAGSRFKGYEEVLVQDLEIRPVVTRYRREVWLSPSGARIVAPLPEGIVGGFGPELRRFIAAGHFQGQVTTERLTALLSGMGVEISKRQVVRLLSGGLQALVAEDQAVLRAGLSTAAWITVDDTSARVGGKDGCTTQVGDDRFACFRTGLSKSRETFLSNLRAGLTDYVINAQALAYMAGRNLAGPVIAQLAAHPDKTFADVAAWTAHLTALGLDQLKVTPDPVTIATEGALWGAVKAHGLIDGTVIVSDGARQFHVGTHALCWVHAERLVHKLQPTTSAHRKAQAMAQTLIWWLYRDLKAYKLAPDPKRARALRARFDRIFTGKTGYVLLDQLLRRLHRRKDELLRVLDRPEIPLHTNGSENDIRAMVTKRKISGGTVSEQGKLARDVLIGLMKTCAKLDVSFWRFLGDRFAVPGAPAVPNLADLVTAKA